MAGKSRGEDMKKKLLIVAIYPAPYRFELMEEIRKEYDADVFFEHSGGDERDAAWFSKGKFYLLDTPAGMAAFRLAKKNLKQYDLVICYDYTTKEEIKLIVRCRCLGIPYCVNADGMKMTRHGNILRDAVKRYLVRPAAGCFASGKNAARYLINNGAREDRIYYHTFSTLHPADILSAPVTEEARTALREKLGLTGFQKIVIAVGRFIPLKRYDALIRAWKTMPEDVLLLLVGGGAEEENYRAVIGESDLHNVRLEGFHPKEELKKYYMAADLFVHPTSYDVWGLVINEAMACGLPAVVSDHCVAGLELVENGVNGYVFTLYDDEEMIRDVKKVLADDETRAAMKKASLEKIGDYTIENMASCQLKAIREILDHA